MEFPDLAPAPADAEPDWTLYSLPLPPPDPEHGEHLGTDTVNSSADVALYRRDDGGLRMVFDDTGCFEISADGATIRWYHAPDVSRRDAWSDLTGRVLAAALHQTGTLSLHGSAAVLDGRAVGVMAPKFHGKSTLTLALVASGGHLLTDDTLPIRPGSPPLACPGLHAARLWADSADRVGLGGGDAPEPGLGSKRLFSSLPAEQLEHEPCPLMALYLLSPVRQLEGGVPARRTRLGVMEATMVMIGHAKLAPLLRGAEAPELFRRAASLAEGVPVYRLNVVRDLERLGEVVELIRSWHGVAVGTAGGA